MSAPAAETPAPAVTKSAAFNYATFLSRVVVAVLILACVWLLWWSYNRVYLPRVKQSRDFTATVTKLTTEVDDLDHRWSKDDIEQINKTFDLLQPKIFAGQHDLESWLGDFREQLAPLGLDIKTDFVISSAPKGAQRGFLVVPTTIFIEFHPVPGSDDKTTSYQRLLQFAHDITTQEKSADLIEMSVDDGATTIGRAVLGFNFWAGAKESK